MELAASIKLAWAAVEESGVPDHVQALAFRETLRAVLGSAQPLAQIGADTRRTDGRDGRSSSDGATDGGIGGSTETVDEQTVIAAVSEHTGVPAKKLEETFHIDNGLVKVSVTHSALGRSTAERARSLAQVITVVRKIGMGHGDTDIDIIREECQRKHIYDSKNFVTQMSGIDGFVVKGKRLGKRLEARSAGIDAFPVLIDKLLGTA